MKDNAYRTYDIYVVFTYRQDIVTRIFCCTWVQLIKELNVTLK